MAEEALSPYYAEMFRENGIGPDMLLAALYVFIEDDEKMVPVHLGYLAQDVESGSQEGCMIIFDGAYLTALSLCVPAEQQSRQTIRMESQLIARSLLQFVDKCGIETMLYISTDDVGEDGVIDKVRERLVQIIALNLASTLPFDRNSQMDLPITLAQVVILRTCSMGKLVNTQEILIH